MSSEVSRENLTTHGIHVKICEIFIAQVNEDEEMVLVNRRRVLERLWASMDASEDSEAVANLRRIRVEGDSVPL